VHLIARAARFRVHFPAMKRCLSDDKSEADLVLEPRDMDEVEIVDYDPRWASLFDEEAKRLWATRDYVYWADNANYQFLSLKTTPGTKLRSPVRWLASFCRETHDSL
jgi:hypothetical protein